MDITTYEKSSVTVLDAVQHTGPVSAGPPPKDSAFWLVIFAVCMSVFLSALELVRPPGVLQFTFLFAR